MNTTAKVTNVQKIRPGRISVKLAARRVTLMERSCVRKGAGG
jgi:hypothetical protein